MLDLVGNPEDRFSHEAAHIMEILSHKSFSGDKINRTLTIGGIILDNVNREKSLINYGVWRIDCNILIHNGINICICPTIPCVNKR